MDANADQFTLERIEETLNRFEARWREGDVPGIGDYLHESPDFCVELLRELVPVDLEYRWRNGDEPAADDALPVRPLLEDYAAEYKLADDTEWLTVELVAAEFYIRSRWGDTPAAAEYCRRFPAWASELSTLLGDVVAELVAETSTAGDGAAAEATNSVSDRTNNCGVAEPLPTRIGRYEILQLLGEGGMGRVYLARDDQLSRQVALKVPTFSRSAGETTIARFRREAQAAGGLQHPNICPVFEFGDENNQCYIAMAYVEGQPLSQVIGDYRNHSSQRDAAALVRMIASAMQSAHEKGVVHRDLKPGNILLTDQGAPIITDFGLVSLQIPTQDGQLSASGEILGTPAYMSPEQVQADGEGVGPTTDIYCLGVIFYELLTGERPFHGSAGSVMAQILHQPVAAPQESRPEIDDGLNALCLRMLAKSPDDRPQSMNEVVRSLTQFLDGEVCRETELVSGAGDNGSIPSVKREAHRPTSDRFRSPRWKKWGGSLIVLVAVLAVTVVVTNRGTVKIETDDPNVSFRIVHAGNRADGARVEIGATSATYWSGDYAIEIVGANADRYDVMPHQFQIQRGKTVVVRITEKTPATKPQTVPQPDASQAAQREATRKTIDKINKLIMPKYESLHVIDTEYNPQSVPDKFKPGMRVEMAWARMRMEMPARYEDVFFLQPPFESRGITDEVVKRLNGNAIQLKYQAACRDAGHRRTQLPADFTAHHRHAGAESLFLIVKQGLKEDGTKHFEKSEWGDKDGDGMPEFWDAWGRPIEWVLWPAGFRSKLQTGKDDEPILAAKDSGLTLGLYKIETYRLWPLIVSAGPDSEFGLYLFQSNSLDIDTRHPYELYRHSKPLDEATYLLGQSDESGRDRDNLHNHALMVDETETKRQE